MDSEVLLNVSHKLSVSVIAEASDIVDMREIGEAFDKRLLPISTEALLSWGKAGVRGSPDNTRFLSDLI